MNSLKLLLTALILCSLSANSVSAETISWNPATTPAPRNDWIERHNGFVARARDGGVEVLFVGDSITDAWRNRGLSVWTERYAPLHAANFGIGGDRTEHVLWRLRNGELNGITPKVAVLIVGVCGAVYVRGILMKRIVAQFKVNILYDDEAYRNTDSQAEDVDKRIQFSFQEVANGKGKVAL